MNTATTLPDDDQPQPLFKPTAWVPTDKRHGPYDLLTDVRDIADGAALLAEMLHRQHCNRDRGDQPLMASHDEGILVRYVAATMNCVRHRIDMHFDDMNDNEIRSLTEYEYPRNAHTNEESK